MATLVAQKITSDGLQATHVPADVAGDDFVNSNSTSGNAFVSIKNGDASPMTVTPVITSLVDGQAVVSKVITIPAGGEKLIGFFQFAAYGPSVSLTYSSVTSVTIAALYF